jgi:hypothetical protein
MPLNSNFLPRSISEDPSFKQADAEMQKAITEIYREHRDGKGSCGLIVRSQPPMPGSRRHPHGR